MAGIGPPPKNPAVRQRRNKKPTAAMIEKGHLRIAIPTLPSGEWHERTVAFWDRLWESEMAGEFVEADVEGLYILARLVDEFWRGNSDRAAEIRLQAQRFGLSPLDRRRLDWKLAEKAEKKPEREAKPKRDFDPSKVLEMPRKKA